jgi:MOSC domain-containing protein YiiM
MKVLSLFIKTEHKKELSSVASFYFSKNGIENNIECLPFRQVLIADKNVFDELKMAPGDLRENILVDMSKLHEIQSGTILKIGDALIRVTFHCEPCGFILNRFKSKQIIHRRGILGLFLNAGIINVGDSVIVLNKQYETIPYSIVDRLQWFLDKNQKPISSLDLLYEIGLSMSYARTLPGLLRKLPSKYKEYIIYKNNLPKLPKDTLHNP